MVADVLLLQHRRKALVLIIQYQITSIFSYATLITLQNDFHRSLCTVPRVSMSTLLPLIIFIILPYAVSKLHVSLQEFLSCLRFLSVHHVLHMPPQEVVKRPDVWCPRRPGLWTKTSSKYEGGGVPRGEGKRDGGS
jgi:hypothetical protein